MVTESRLRFLAKQQRERSTEAVNDKLREQLTQALKTGALKPVHKQSSRPMQPAKKTAQKVTPEPTKKQEKVTLEVNLDKAVALAERIVVRNGMIPLDDTMQRLETIRELVHPFGTMFSHSRTKECLDLRSAAETCQNYLATVASGLQENDIDPPMLPSVVRKLKEYVATVATGYKAAEARLKQPVEAEVDETLTPERINKFRAFKAHIGTAIKKAQDATLSNTRPVLVRMPVLVLVDPTTRTADLLNAGFPAEGYDGLYSIMLDQMVVGIPHDAEDQQGMLASAVAHLRKKNASYDFVTNQSVGMPKYGMLFYWVATGDFHARLANVKGRALSVKTWSFPF